MLDFSSFQTINKVIYLTEEDCDFSEFYLKVRQKEQRILSDKDILKLPNLNRYEWPLRIKSTKRFTDYISAKKKQLTNTRYWLWQWLVYQQNVFSFKT